MIKNPVLKGFITFPAFDEIDDWYVFVYKTDQFSGKLIDSAEGHLQWIENVQLLDLNLWEGDKIFLPWLEQEKIFSAKFIYNDKSLQDFSVIFY